MSGIVGICNALEPTIDLVLLNKMTSLMSYRGSDRQNIWTDQAVGFGHALLATSLDQQSEVQPFGLEGRWWVVADIRLDNRSSLRQVIQAEDGQCPDHASDCELVLRAYRLWGEACLQHLLGDFSFAIWDCAQHRLFCARDQFGIKPFYYAHIASGLAFSNTLNCLRLHPEISAELNDLAIADFLIFGSNQDPATTAFAKIYRLPPAHCLSYTTQANQSPTITIQRYWTLPIDGHIRYKRPLDYVEHFQELMTLAVGDRLRTNQASVLMSGGLDSSTIAAFANQVLGEQQADYSLQAFTVVYDRIMPDQERYYAGLVASALKIPIHYTAVDDYTLFEGWDDPSLFRPEPVMNPLLLIAIEQLCQASHHGRVLLVGEGGDPVLYPSSSYFFEQLQTGHWFHIFQAMLQYVYLANSLPKLGIRTQLRQWLRPSQQKPIILPSWLNPELVSCFNLLERCLQFSQLPKSEHPVRSLAHCLLQRPAWATIFEGYDPGVTQLPLEVRYPFFDLRLVSYLLAIPPIPWFIHKELARVAMKERLPAAVCRRPKTPLSQDPLSVAFQHSSNDWLSATELSLALTRYVIWDRVPFITSTDRKIYHSPRDLYPFCLAKWFESLNSYSFTIPRGSSHAIQ